MIRFVDDATDTYAIGHYDVSSGVNGAITLQDSTKIVLQGYTGTLSVKDGSTTSTNTGHPAPAEEHVRVPGVLLAFDGRREVACP